MVVLVQKNILSSTPWFLRLCWRQPNPNTYMFTHVTNFTHHSFLVFTTLILWFIWLPNQTNHDPFIHFPIFTRVWALLWLFLRESLFQLTPLLPSLFLYPPPVTAFNLWHQGYLFLYSHTCFISLSPNLMCNVPILFLNLWMS